MVANDWIGYIAGALTTFAFLPQVIRVWRTRSAGDISLGMYWTYTIGIALWLAYGVMIGSPPVIVANAVTLLLSGAVLALKLRYSRGTSGRRAARGSQGLERRS